jgi:hypothetical protein
MPCLNPPSEPSHCWAWKLENRIKPSFLSLSLIVSHSLSLSLIVSHCLSLSLIVSHCIICIATQWYSHPIWRSFFGDCGEDEEDPDDESLARAGGAGPHGLCRDVVGGAGLRGLSQDIMGGAGLWQGRRRLVEGRGFGTCLHCEPGGDVVGNEILRLW